MNWQPIETAPRDGKRVLIRADCVLVAGWERGVWAVVNDVYVADHMATHWHPLPEPPK